MLSLFTRNIYNDSFQSTFVITWKHRLLLILCGIFSLTLSWRISNIWHWLKGTNVLTTHQNQLFMPAKKWTVFASPTHPMLSKSRPADGLLIRRWVRVLPEAFVAKYFRYCNKGRRSSNSHMGKNTLHKFLEYFWPNMRLEKMTRKL